MSSLKTWEEFQIVMSGSLISRSTYFSLHACDRNLLVRLNQVAGEKEQTLFGVLVPKRCAKKAVTRNAIKRQIRANFISQKNLLLTKAYVIRLHKDVKFLQSKSATSIHLKEIIRNDLKNLFEKIGSK